LLHLPSIVIEATLYWLLNCSRSGWCFGAFLRFGCVLLLLEGLRIDHITGQDRGCRPALAGVVA
jgi:hypothetical protein